MFPGRATIVITDFMEGFEINAFKVPLRHLKFQFLEGKSARLIVETYAEFSIVLFLLIST